MESLCAFQSKVELDNVNNNIIIIIIIIMTVKNL